MVTCHNEDNSGIIIATFGTKCATEDRPYKSVCCFNRKSKDKRRQKLNKLADNTFCRMADKLNILCICMDCFTLEMGSICDRL